MFSVLPYHLIARGLLIALLLVAAYFFKDFLIPVLVALIIGFASWPLYQRLHEALGERDALASGIAILVIVLVLIVPLSFAFSLAFQEFRQWGGWLIEVNRTGLPVPPRIAALPGIGPWLAAVWQDNLASPHGVGEVIRLVSGEQIGNLYRLGLSFSGKAINLLLGLLFMLITLFFFYKDGKNLSRQLDVIGERVLPYRWQRFSRVVPATVSSTVLGMGLIAIGEGLVLGVAYAIAGVQSPVILGVITGFMALVPGGAPLSFTLVSLSLGFSGHTGAAIGLFLWGTLELFIVDKTLRPRLVGGPIKLPFLPTFFGLVGGAKTLGLVGLFLGPILMALLVAIWREWLRAAQEEPALPAIQAERPESQPPGPPDNSGRG